LKNKITLKVKFLYKNFTSNQENFAIKACFLKKISQIWVHWCILFFKIKKLLNKKNHFDISNNVKVLKMLTFFFFSEKMFLKNCSLQTMNLVVNAYDWVCKKINKKI